MQQVLEPFVLALGVSMQVILASLKLQFHFLKLLLVLQNLRTFALELITCEDVRVCVHTVKLEFIFPLAHFFLLTLEILFISLLIA